MGTDQRSTCYRLVVLGFALLLSGCLCRSRQDDSPLTQDSARRPTAGATAPTLSRQEQLQALAKQRATVVRTARDLLGHNRVVVQGAPFRFDCSGFVAGVYHAVGIDLMALGSTYRNARGVDLIHHYANAVGGLHRRRPVPGDIVFFDNTYDANRDGRWNARLTHVGIVERVDDDETVHFIHLSGQGIRRDRLNLAQPHNYADPNTEKQVNSFLRRRTGNEPARARFLSGELFAGYGSVIGRRPPR